MDTKNKNKTGDEWTQMLLNDPSQEDKCIWSKLDGANWAALLSKMPKFAKQCKKTIDNDGNNAWKKLKGPDWAQLLSVQPKFAKQCDKTIVDENGNNGWKRLNGSDWASLLSVQPKFAKQCDKTIVDKYGNNGWKKLNGSDWVALLLKRPQFERKCNNKSWKKLAGTDWAKLLAEQPQLAARHDALIKWDEMDGWCWSHLLEREPQFADRCKKWYAMNGSCWATLLAKQPGFEGKCDECDKWSMLDDWGWDHLLNSVKDEKQKRRFENKRKGVVDRTSAAGEYAIRSKSGERTEIVLNRMFNGGYLDDNIGHEIINMFQDDHGANYIYILPWGGYAPSHHGKIGWVVLTRLVPKREALEVLALAKELQDVYDPDEGHGPGQWENQKKFLEDNKVTYGNAKLVDILGDGSETAGLKQAVWISMRAGSVLRPNRPVYIVFGSNDTIEDKDTDAPKHYSICLENTKRARQSQKQYLKPDDTDYLKLKKELVDNESLWENAKSTSPIGAIDPSKIEEDSFFDICGIADRELAFSDALAYFFRKYPSLATGFLQEKLQIKLSADFDCLREWENIDLLLEDEHQIVVIENKIMSSINGIKMTEEEELSGSQLDKYWKIAEKRAKGEYLEDEDLQKLFLATYPKKLSCLILTPNYNKITPKNYNTPDFDCEKHYQVITYKDLYDYLIYDYLKDKVPNDRYFVEFIKGMKAHTDEHHNDPFKKMENQFKRRIMDMRNRARF